MPEQLYPTAGLAVSLEARPATVFPAAGLPVSLDARPAIPDSWTPSLEARPAIVDSWTPSTVVDGINIASSACKIRSV